MRAFFPKVSDGNFRLGSVRLQVLDWSLVGVKGGEVVLLLTAPAWRVTHQGAHSPGVARVSQAGRGTDRVTDKTRQTSLLLLLLLVIIIICYCCFCFWLINVAFLAVKDNWIVFFFFFVCKQSEHY